MRVQCPVLERIEKVLEAGTAGPSLVSESTLQACEVERITIWTVLKIDKLRRIVRLLREWHPVWRGPLSSVATLLATSAGRSYRCESSDNWGSKL